MAKALQIWKGKEAKTHDVSRNGMINPICGSCKDLTGAQSDAGKSGHKGQRGNRRYVSEGTMKTRGSRPDYVARQMKELKLQDGQRPKAKATLEG